MCLKLSYKVVMRELTPAPICLACGSPLELTMKRQATRYAYKCVACSFGNHFETKKFLICPVCFSDLLIVRDQQIRVSLCSNPACDGYREGERGNFRFRTIRHTGFKNYLDWSCLKNYFRFYQMVGIDFHNHLVRVANTIIDAQGWNWEERPKLRERG